MCNKNSPPLTHTDNQPISIMKKTKKQIKDFSSSSSSSSSLKPLGRKNRTKTRKPKFLSLRLQLSQNQNQPKKTVTHQKNQPKTQQPQLNLFPLHPENLVDDKDMHEENNVALLFSSDGGATLNGLLEDESITTNTNTTTTAATTSEEGSFSPPAASLTCLFDGVGGDSGSWLVRKAMRRSNKERDDEGSEERWVCYSEVVEKKEMMEEVTSYCAAAATATATATTAAAVMDGGRGLTTSFGLLSLKLDHEGILNAWSDKGSLYVEGEAPQTVPDLVDGVPLDNALAPYVIFISLPLFCKK